jgi:YHS domain-containing protein
MRNRFFFAAIPVLAITGFFVTRHSNNICRKNSACAMTSSCNMASHSNGFSVDTLRKDPVCGMKTDDTKADTIHYKGTVYAFCSKSCKDDFVKNPQSYIQPTKQR